MPSGVPGTGFSEEEGRVSGGDGHVRCCTWRAGLTSTLFPDVYGSLSNLTLGPDLPHVGQSFALCVAGFLHWSVPSSSRTWSGCSPRPAACAPPPRSPPHCLAQGYLFLARPRLRPAKASLPSLGPPEHLAERQEPRRLSDPETEPHFCGSECWASRTGFKII